MSKIQFMFSRSLWSRFNLYQWFSTEGNIVPQGIFGNIWKYFWLSQIVMGVAAGGYRPRSFYISYSAQDSSLPS